MESRMTPKYSWWLISHKKDDKTLRRTLLNLYWRYSKAVYT